MNRKLAIKFIVPTAALVFAAFAVTGYVAKSMLERVIRAQAERVMADSVRHVTDSLSVVHELSSQQSRAAITIFSSMVRSAGEVSVKGKSKAIGDELPDLMIGKESVVGKYGLVDKVNGLTGATATIFVKRGTDFVRVSTNVKKDDGSRAVGTVLDPNGKAIANLRQGIEFNGVVDILGSPYMTTYVPLRSGSEIVGALYVGFPLKSLSGLNNTIHDQKILEHGHIAVIDGKGKIRFASGNADQAVVTSQLQGNQDGWNVVKSDFAPWGYTLIAAYPESDVANAVSALKLSLVIFSLTAASLMVAAQFWLVKRCVVKPVGLIVAHLKDVAEGEGDLTKRITVNTHDELSDLAGWFNQFMERLEKIIVQVAASTEKISSASEEISASAMQVAESSEHQKDQTHQVATAMAEMHSTVMQVSENSSRAAETAQHAGELAHGGGKVVEETISVIRQVAESTRETAAKIEHLGKSSDQIGKIIGVIDDIADQTNLLALNAAIEAARAGDQGRGFAVVADEVRKLAERTTGATKEIAQMISAIQVETSKAVEAMEVGTKRVDAGVQTAQKAGDALRDIIESSEHVHNLVTHIATASAQQATATDHINVNMDQIADMVQSASTGAQESAQACVGLSDLAMELQGLVNRFKIREQQRMQSVSAPNGNALMSRNSNAAHDAWIQ